MANRADYIHNMAERIRKQQNNGSTYQPYQIQTSYGSRTVGEKEYSQKVAQRRKEQEEQKKQQREDDMAARGITSPQMKRIYNANEDAKEYAAALNRASLNKNLQNMQPKVGENAWQISPASIKLQKGLSQNVVDELGKKIENEQNIISNQGRDAESEEVKNAQKTLKDLQGRMADAQKWQRSLPETGKLAPMGKFEAAAAGVVGPAYSPEEEAYIRKIQQRLENGQKKKQPIGYAYTPEENYRRHMQNTPDGSDQAEYMRWLQEGESIGLYDRQTMNAMIANMGDLTPAEQYQQLSASEKSGWLREGQGALRLKSLEEAKKYNEEHGAGQDRELLQQQLDYWQTLADDAQKRFDVLHGNIGIEFAPEGQQPYLVRSRMNPYYRDPQYKEQIDEKFFDAIAGTGAYQKTKEEFMNDPEMGQDGFDYLLETAWTDYEQGNYDQLYYDLTGENDYADLESQLNGYKDQIKELSGQLKTIQKYDDYMAQYQDVVREGYVQENDRGFTSLVNPARRNARESYNDPYTSDIHRIYSFINGGNEFYAYYRDTKEENRQITRAYHSTAFMLPDEIEIFDGFYNNGEYDKATAFLQGLSQTLNQRASYYDEIETREQARKYPILSSINSLTAELFSGAGAVARTFAGAAGDKSVEDPNSPWYASTRYTTQTQEEIADMIGGEGGKVYLAGMNALRNMMNAAAISTLGITGPWAGAAGLAMFATQIYQDSTYKYLKEYNDYDKAVSYALLDATLETMEEKLPYDVMLSGGSNIFLNWLASSISEGLEELTGATLGEEIKAQLTNSGRREWEIRRDKIYNEGGYTDEAGNWITIDTKDSRKALAEAQTQALREYGQQIISNTLSGMAGGGIGGVYGAANNYVQNTRIGRTINNQANNVDNTSGGTQLINVARGMFNESQSRQLAEQLYKKTQENKKVSNYEIGKLARSIVLETSQEGGKITRETVERLIQQQMRNEGANEDTIKEAAPIIASAVIDGNKLSKGEFNVLAGSKQAIDTYKTFMSSEGALTAAATAISNPDVQKMQSIRETVGKLMEGGKGKAVTASVTADIVKAAEKTRIANQDDLDHVTKGVQTGSGMDAILNDEIVQVIGRNKDGYEIQHEDGTTETVSEDNILAVDKKLGVLMEYGMQNSGLLGDMGFAEIVKGIAQNGKAGDGQYLAEAMKIYLAARTLGAQPVSILNKETADAIWKAAQEENEQANKDRHADRQEKVIPGKGTSEFNGAQYGTKEWNQKLNDAGLTKQQKNQAGAVAEYAKRLGFHVTFVNNPDMEAEYGWEDRATGKIYINLAGRHADYTIGGKKYSGDSHNLLVTASHEFTHWLEQNSPQEYAELRQFVFNKLRRAGQDIESLVMRKMDLYRSMAEATKAADTEAQVQELDLEGAMAEIVANACDQVLGSEKVAAEIEKTSPKLYEKVKQFVTNLVARIREAAAGMDSSMSRESRIMTTWADELQDHWLRTLKEAQGREQGQAEAQEGVQHSRREEDFSYENLTKKGNVNIVKMEEISDSDFQTEESKSSNEFARDIINEIKARNNGSVEVVNNDTKNAIIIAKDGIKHSRGRELTKGYVQVARQIDNILKNSIAVNELEGRPNVSNYSTIYIGIAETDDDYVAVRTIVNNKNHRTESVDVLYAISKNEIKKGGSAIKAPGPLAQIARGSGSPSLISVTDMLDIVKRADNAATVLSKDVADKLGITRKNIKGLSESLKYSIRELSNQDQEYADAVERGDMQAATDMLMDKLQQTENIIPFNAPNWYAGEHADVAQLIKNGTPEAIAKAAASMASYVPDNAALVPMPNHHGEVNANTDTMILANALSELTGRPVIAALAGADRESRYDSKVAGGRGIQANEMGFRQVAEIPDGMIPIFIDNVVGSGETAKAARDALGGGITLAYAKSVRSKGIQGLKRATVTYDKNGNLIPLSERFNLDVRDIRYSIREDSEYMRMERENDAARETERNLGEKYRQLINSDEINELQEKYHQAEDRETKKELLKEMKAWEEKNNISELKDQMYDAAQKVRETQKALEDYYDQVAEAEERAKIEKSGLTEAEWRRKEAVKEFGYTTNFREAGYLLPNGKMLNFSGDKGVHTGHRGEDHRGISRIFATKQGAEAMNAFMADGNIRIMAETPGIDIIKTAEPTAEQYAMIRKMAEQFARGEYFNVDFSDEQGYNVGTIEYDGRVNGTRIVNDIKSYYKTGEVPQQSLTSQFHYSIREMDNQYMQAVKAGDRGTAQWMVDAQAIKSGFTTENAFHGTASFGFDRFDMEASGGAIFVAYSPKIAGTYVDNGDVRMIGKKYPVIGLDIMSAEQLAEELQEYYRNLPKTYGYETASEWTVKGIDKDDYVDFVLDYAENMKKLAAGKVFEKELTRLVDKLVALAHTGDEKAAYQAGVDLQRRFRMADFFGQDDLDNRRIELSAMMIPALAKGEDVININRHGMNYYLSRSDVIRQLEKYNEDREGIYKFYTRPGNQLLIDAKGANWNRIWIEDEYLRNDIWGYFNPTEAYEAATGQREYSTDMFTVTTRELSEYARYRKYDSVRINDVFDHGGRGDWDRERGHGDIAMFFNPNDVKSADPVTYDENGDVVPLSERFSDNDDLRFSFRDEGDMEINRWMQGLTPSSLKTEQERVMLRQWQEAKGGLDVAWHALSEHQAKLRKLEAMQNPSAFDRNEIIKEKNRIQNWRAKVDDYEKQMVKATREKGFAHLMYSQSKLMDDLASGRSVEQVKETVEAIKKEIARVDTEMAAREQKIKELADSAAVKQIESLMSGVQLDRMAKWLRTTYNSNFNKQQLMASLSEIRLKMASGEDVTSDAEELAWKLLYGIQAESDSVLAAMRGITLRLGPAQIREIYGSDMSLKEIRSRLAGTGIKVEKAKKSGLDADWQQLVKMVPELDTEENKNELNQVSAILNLVEKRKEEQQNYGVNQYGGNIADVTNDVLAAAAAVNLDAPKDPAAMAILRRMNTLINEMAGGMKKGAEELAEAREKLAELAEKGKLASDLSDWVKKDIQDAIAYNNALAQQSEAATWKNERHKLINQLNDEHTKAMLKQQEEFREKLENDKTARGKMNENMALRRRINTNVNRLRKLLIHESTKDNVPEHMKGIVREMLTRIVDNDLTGRKITGIAREDLIKINRVLTAFEKQDGKYNPDDLKTMDEAVQDVLYNALEDLKSGIEYYNGQTKGKKLLENLESFNGALTEISNAVSVITGIVNAERSIVLGNRRTSVENQAYKVQEYAGDRRKKELTGKVGMTLNEIHKFVISGNLTPEYFFRMLKNAGLDELWEEYHREENKNGLELAKAKERLDQIAKKYGFAAWDMEKRQEVNLQSGKVNMTLGQIMSLYATWKREHTLGPAMSQHLTHGGFYVEEVDPRKGILGSQVTDLKAHRVKDEDMEQVEKLLTKEQIDFVNEIVSYMSNEMSELGNDASMKAYGIKLYKESYYFPFKMWDGVKAKASNDSGSAAKVDQVFRPSFSKTRLHGANNAVILGDFMQTATDHIVGMINYATMGLANENMQKVLNAQVAEGDRLDTMTKRNIRTVLQEAYGKEAMQYLAKLQEQLNGGAVRMDRTLYDKALTLFRKNAVAGSMSVTLQQPLSYIRAAMLINPKYLAQAISPTYWKGSYAEMMAHSGVANIKKMGRFDMGFGASAREYITPDGMETKARKVWNEITDKATILPELADQMTWTRMWSAVKLEQHELHPKMDMNSEEFLDMVATRFNELMRRTQVYDSVLTKSQNMRSQNPFMKSITSFMAEPTLSLNVLMDAVRNAKGKGGKAMLAKAVTTFLLSAVAQAAVKAVMSSGRSPDDKKTWAENFWYRFWQNAINETDPLNLVPGYNDLVTVLKSGKLEDDALGAIGKIFSAGEKLMNITGNPADYRSWEDSAGQLVQLFTKLPAKNIMRDLRAAYNWFIGKTYADRDTSGAVLRQQTMASFMTADNLIGAINAKLGEAGYKTSNEAYYNRLYGAMQGGNKQATEDIKEYLQLIKNQDEKKQATGLRAAAKKDESMTTAQQDEWMLKNDLLDSTATLTTQYKEGKITASEYKKLAKAAEPELTDNDVWWKIDRIDYQKEKGGDSVSGYYYRLTDAVNANKVEDIQKAVKDLLAHGITKEKIKNKLSDWKQAYLAADNAGKIKIRDALQKAYKAAGYTAKDADKTIESWKKDAEKKK